MKAYVLLTIFIFFTVCLSGIVSADSTALVLTKTADKEQVFSGDILTYTITVANTGSDSVSDVVVIDTWPQPKLELLDYPLMCVVDAAGVKVECDVGTIDAGEEKIITLIGQVIPVSGNIENNAMVKGTNAVDRTLTEIVDGGSGGAEPIPEFPALIVPLMFSVIAYGMISGKFKMF